MQLDGDNVLVGDLIFDILLGINGTVTIVTGSNYTVDFGAGRRLTYHQNGKVANVRRAYWRDPVMFAPRKVEPRWAQMTQAATIVREAP